MPGSATIDRARDRYMAHLPPHRSVRRRHTNEQSWYSAHTRPDLLETTIAAASVSIEPVLGRVLLVVVLVIFLRRIEGGRGRDGHDNPLTKELFHLRLRRFSRGPLCIVVNEDLGTVLSADVAELSVCDKWIDVVPVAFEELLVADNRWIEHDTHRLRVSGCA